MEGRRMEGGVPSWGEAVVSYSMGAVVVAMEAERVSASQARCRYLFGQMGKVHDFRKRTVGLDATAGGEFVWLDMSKRSGDVGTWLGGG